MLSEVQLRTSKGLRRFTIDEAYIQSLGPVMESQGESVALFLTSWLSLLSDSPLAGEGHPPSRYHDFLKQISQDGLKETIIRLSNLAHELVSRPMLMGTPTLMGEWIHGFTDTPVFREYHEWYKTGNTEVLRYLYSFLCFGKKLEIEDPSFGQAALRGWLSVEDRLTSLKLADGDVATLRLILKTILPPLEFQDFRPKFGPGSVQERGVRGKHAKIENLKYDHLINRFLLNGHLGNYGVEGESGTSVRQALPAPDTWTPDKGISSRVSRLLFVPKNIKVARAICMEPNTLMFFQQGVLREICRCIKSSQLRYSIKLEDQLWNQQLCEIGSFSSEIDTLDLSAASDSVSWDLVKGIFPASWRIAMHATRSSSVYLPDGSERSVAKYAPMGSALCFPTQCIIFASVCIHAACWDSYEKLRRCDSENVLPPFEEWLTPSRIRSAHAKFNRRAVLDDGSGYQALGVYGDDICVDRRLSDIVIATLTRLGFEVNLEKSFRGSQAFRESCGAYFLNGSNVTPLYYRVKGVQPSLTAEHVASQVHLINEAWDREYRNLYNHLRSTILRWGVEPWLRNRTHAHNPIPYTDDPSTFGIMCKHPFNHHLKRRDNTDLQRVEGRSWTITYKDVFDREDLQGSIEKYIYSQWWATRQRDSFQVGYKPTVLMTMTVNGLPKTVRVGTSRSETGRPGLHWKWIPVQ